MAIVVVAALMAIAGLITGGGARAAAPPLRPIDPPVHVVSIGDSYTAGQGVSPQISPAVPRCRRSLMNFPRLVETKLEYRVGDTTTNHVSLTDASCSSATTAHTTNGQQTQLGVNPPQFDAFPASGSGINTDYVTIGFGANDIVLLGILGNCRDVHKAGLETCEHAMTRVGRDPLADIAATAGAIDAVIAGARLRAPFAVILVVGYPTIVPSAGSSACVPVMGLGVDDMEYFDGVERALNGMLAQRAFVGGARFVDTYAPSVGHDACRTPSVRWIEPPTKGSALVGDHPNANGQRKIADAVVARIFAAS
jgi:lysophospholipase L1-like esterase